MTKERESSEISRSMQSLLGERLQKDGYREPIDKNKWISKSDFNGAIGVASTNLGFSKTTDTYVSREPSETPLLHKFRQASPTKWLYGGFKF